MSSRSASSNGHFTSRERGIALGYGTVSLALFFTAVGVMMVALYQGLHFGFGRLAGWQRIAANTALLLQFPILHSVLLSRFGRSWLSRLAPAPVARSLQPTTYVLIASIQILAVFLLWSPGPAILWEPQGPLRWVHNVCFTLAWLALGKSMWDGHLGVQMGYIGWLSVWRRLPAIPWPDLPTRGFFRLCRQPIYFSFMLTLWTGPTWTIDKIYTATVWTVYCFVGPYFKERRQLRVFGAKFLEYCARVPYWPGLQPRRIEVKHCEDQR